MKTKTLKQKILKEMVREETPIEKIKKEVFEIIEQKYYTYLTFEVEFERAYKKVMKKAKVMKD